LVLGLLLLALLAGGAVFLLTPRAGITTHRLGDHQLQTRAYPATRSRPKPRKETIATPAHTTST